MDLKELFHPKFFEVFNEDELKEIYERSFCGTEECYVIFNQKYFFELSADIDDELEIYCDECTTYNKGEVIDKYEFLKRLRAYPPRDGKVVELD
ncbi:hypothetical protein [Hydrogenimonas thermophila]|uniref:Uncharacterized protein n=1 Tax=Hydrogenimonas thermophila TaxID=223786 RepID=A0A1I5TP10_9BACT|nr:hypothetical protein [Hydrogenimonas thermophila]SFP84773.1 hypothetical protein SAMN05216234_14617 [Hydrogenimonas thermophila]